MEEEIESLTRNKTWILVHKPKHQKIVDCKRVYKIKEGEPNSRGKWQKALHEERVLTIMNLFTRFLVHFDQNLTSSNNSFQLGI